MVALAGCEDLIQVVYPGSVAANYLGFFLLGAVRQNLFDDLPTPNIPKAAGVETIVSTLIIPEWQTRKITRGYYPRTPGWNQ